MQNLTFAGDKSHTLRLLCLGAHSDDIEIGCGGTVLRLLDEYEETSVCWVVLASSGRRDEEAVASAEKFLTGAKRKEIIVADFRDGFFPYHGERVKEFFEGLKVKTSPDIIFTPYRNDLHQDHRLVSELTWNTYRNHLILEYEIVKYDGDIGNPNLFVHLTESLARRKVGILLDSFRSQLKKNWFTEDAFLAILRLRGLECNAPEKYAKAYHARKLVL